MPALHNFKRASMKKILTIIVATIAAIAASAQPDAEYGLLRRTYKANADGSIDITVRKELKLIRNRAFTAYADKGETFIVYNPAFESLKINESYTVRADGSKVNTPPNAFVEQLPSEAQNCGRYNALREMAVVHTALEYGCTIVLDYTIHRRSNKLYDEFSTVMDCPVKRFEVVIDDPQHLLTATYDADFSHDGKTYTLVNVPQSTVDSYLPATVNGKHFVVSSVAPAAYPALFTFKSEKLPVAASAISNLTKSDPLEYATALRDYVVDYIRLNNIDPGKTNFEHADAATVWNSGCGTAVDKAVLLAAMLRQAGFEASTTFRRHECLVQCTIDGMTYHMSATDPKKPPLYIPGLAHSSDIMISRKLAWNPVTLGNGYYLVDLPAASGHIDMRSQLLTSVRTAPLSLPDASETYAYTLVLPDSLNLQLLTKESSYKSSKEGKWSITVTIRRNANTVLITRIMMLNACTLEGKDYKAFRQALQQWDTSRQLHFKAN